MTPRARLLVAVAIVAAAIPLRVLAGNTPEEPPTPTVLTANDEEVQKLLAAVATAKEDKNDDLLSAALLDMGTRRHESFEPIIADNIDNKDAEIQARAIRAAASNGMEGVSKQVVKILKASKKSKKGKKKGEGDVSGYVAAAAIDYVARLAVEGVEDEVLEHLDQLFAVESRVQSEYAEDMVRGAVHYMGQMKHDPAVPRLVEMVHEPAPADPNAASNPPAAYWEARHKIWVASEGWVRWALKEITGQEYRSPREWDAWLDANAKKYK